MKKITLSVTQRHDNKYESIFGTVIAPELLLTPDALEKIASRILEKKLSTVSEKTWDRLVLPVNTIGNLSDYKYNVELELVVTGLTVATLAIVKAAMSLVRHCTCLHYDKDSNTYYKQKMF